MLLCFVLINSAHEYHIYYAHCYPMGANSAEKS